MAHSRARAAHTTQYDDGHGKREYGHCVVAGIERYPLFVTKTMTKKKIEKRQKIKPFVKVINYNHLMPTRCAEALNHRTKAE